MIQVENLVKTFDGFRALDGADFHVKKDAIYGLVGPEWSRKIDTHPPSDRDDISRMREVS